MLDGLSERRADKALGAFRLLLQQGEPVGALFGRDIVSVEDAKHPRAAFVWGGIPEHHSTDMCDESTASESVGTA